jgi:rhodanese-related sulfurtransferase
MGTLVTETPAASSDVALRHFEEMLAFETDCWDVHEGLKSPIPDFTLVDVRGPASFANGHVQGAINIPHGQMTASRMAEFPKDKLFVVYCAGPHCNGANKAALRLARLGLPVKMMIGGITGWLDEAFSLATAVAKSGSETLNGSHR